MESHQSDWLRCIREWRATDKKTCLNSSRCFWPWYFHGMYNYCQCDAFTWFNNCSQDCIYSICAQWIAATQKQWRIELISYHSFLSCICLDVQHFAFHAIPFHFISAVKSPSCCAALCSHFVQCIIEWISCPNRFGLSCYFDLTQLQIGWHVYVNCFCLQLNILLASMTL